MRGQEECGWSVRTEGGEHENSEHERNTCKSEHKQKPVEEHWKESTGTRQKPVEEHESSEYGKGSTGTGAETW